MNQPFAVEKANYHGFHFGFAHSRLLWPWRSRGQPLLALSFSFGVILKEPIFITSNNSIEKSRIIFNLLETILSYVYSVGLLLSVPFSRHMLLKHCYKTLNSWQRNNRTRVVKVSIETVGICYYGGGVTGS